MKMHWIAAVAALSMGAAHATTVFANGTANIGTAGSSIGVSGNVSNETLTQIDFSSFPATILAGGGGVDTYLGNPNEFNFVLPADGDPLTFGSNVIDITDGASSASFSDLTTNTAAGTGLIGTFQATSETFTISGTIGGSVSYTIFLTGTITPDAQSPYTTATDAQAIFTISQTSPTAAVSFSGTFSSPPNITGVPEPATFGLMGAGLLGIGLARRKRNA